jgi:hypothetical protein
MLSCEWRRPWTRSVAATRCFGCAFRHQALDHQPRPLCRELVRFPMVYEDWLICQSRTRLAFFNLFPLERHHSYFLVAYALSHQGIKSHHQSKHHSSLRKFIRLIWCSSQHCEAGRGVFAELLARMQVLNSRQNSSLDSDRFCQIPRLIHIRPLGQRGVIRQQLQWHYVQDGR